MISGGSHIASPTRSSKALPLPALTEHFRALAEVTSDWLWEVDTEGRYTYVSPKVKDLLGYEVAEVLGRAAFDFMRPAEATRVRAAFALFVRDRAPFRELLNVNLHKGGAEVVLESSGVPVFGANGLLEGFRGIDRDVTHREHELHRLRLADAAVQASAEGIVVADAQGNITACNPVFSSMSGFTEAELLGRPPSMLSSSEEGRERLWDLLGHAAKWVGEGQCRHRIGEPFPVWITISAVRTGEQVTGFVALVSDMTERQLAEATIRFQATHDALTQLSNRAAWLSSFRRALTSAHANGSRASVLFVDLDGFKAVNDKYGHGVGDVLLSTTARRLEGRVRRTDLVGRMGGDEFTILLTDVTRKGAPERVAKACVKALSRPFRIDGIDVRISASIGLAVFPQHGTSVDALVAVADGAMYVAKRAGGGRVQVAGEKVKASGAAGTRSTKRSAAGDRTSSRRSR